MKKVCILRSQDESLNYPVSFRVGAGPYRHCLILKATR